VISSQPLAAASINDPMPLQAIRFKWRDTLLRPPFMIVAALSEILQKREFCRIY